MKRYSMVSGVDPKRQRADDHISASQLEYRRLRDTLGLTKLELTSTRTSSKALEELRYTHPIRALELAEAAEIVARRSTELAQRLRCISDVSSQHESWLPLEMWRHIMRFLPHHDALLGVTRELTTLVMSEYRGALKLCSRTLFRTHKGGRKEELPTWCNFSNMSLVLNEDVHQDEWRLVCSILSALFSAERATRSQWNTAQLRKLVVTGSASSFLENYNSMLNVDELDVSVHRHTFPALCAMSGRARVLRISSLSADTSMPLVLPKMNCSAYMLDASATDMKLLRRILQASVASEIRFSHLFLPLSLTASNLDTLDCALLLRVKALHFDVRRIDNFQFESVVRIARNSATLKKLYIHTDGYSLDVREHPAPNVRAVSKSVVDYWRAHSVEFKTLREGDRLAFVIHQGYGSPGGLALINTIEYATLEQTIGEKLPYPLLNASNN